MMILPSPTYYTNVPSMGDYHIFTFGEPESGLCATTVFKDGEIRDSYLSVGAPGAPHSYITLEFVK